MAISNVLAALVATCVTLFLTRGQVAAWGWRIPFVVGLAIGPVGIWLRATLDETPEFRAEMERAHKDRQSLQAPLLRGGPGPPEAPCSWAPAFRSCGPSASTP